MTTVENDILMPAISPGAETGMIARWMVGEGDLVNAGDVIAEVSTGTTTMEIEAEDDGRIKILVAAGTDGVLVNTPIATLSIDQPAEQGLLKNLPEAAAEAAAVAEITAAGPRLVGSDVQAAGVALRSAVAATPAAQPHGTGAQTITQSYSAALGAALAEEMRRDPDVLLMGEEVGQNEGVHKVSRGLLEEFGPRRVIDTPITPAGFAGIGVGAAFAGLKPVVEFMTWNFAMQAIDQIVNSAAKTHYMSGGKLNVPIVFRGANGASDRAGAQHAQCYSAWYAHVPGLKVVAPATAADAKGLLKAAIRDSGPVLVLEHEQLYGQIGPVPVHEDWLVPIGVAQVARAGRDATIVTYGRCVPLALAASERLADEGIDAEVIDLRTLRPLDMATVLASVARTNRIVTVEEAWPVCSVGSEVCARVAIDAFDDLDAPPEKVSGADVPMPYAANLERLARPSSDDVVAAVRRVCYA